MKIRDAIFLSILALLLMNVKCTVNTDPPNLRVNLNIPYIGQEYFNYCGIACLQMWARWDDNHAVTQNQIAQEVGISPNGYLASPYHLESAVPLFTHSIGYLERRSFWDLGVEGDMIAAAIEGIKWDTPAIMPVDDGDHVILLKGFEWIEKPDKKPFAIRAMYHNPAGENNREISASLLQANFAPAPDYWLILGDRSFVWNGEIGHDLFVMKGGTYYGGPSDYNPKKLDTSMY